MVEKLPPQPSSEPSPHPQADAPAFLPRLGSGQQRLVPLLSERGVKTTVAPLYFLSHNPQLSLLPGSSGLGVVLDPCTHIRQQPHIARAGAFRLMPFGADPEPFEPETAAVTDEQLGRLVVEPQDLQRANGATLLLTTYHVAGPMGSRGRDLELLLAEAGIAHFHGERIDEPLDEHYLGPAREIYAVVAIDVRHLRSPTARHALADAYLSLDAHGYWVKLLGFDERASQSDIQAGATFLAELRAGGKPVVSCGPGQLYVGLLADDISASIGLSQHERFRWPTDWTARRGEKKQRVGRTRMAYHPKYQRSFRVGSDKAKRAFENAACPCGVHAAKEPPAGIVVDRHAAILRTAEAAEAVQGERAERREWVLGAATMASWAAADADVEHTATSVYEALFDGLDAGGREAATGEQLDF